MGTCDSGVSDGQAFSRALLEPERAELQRDARRFAVGLSLASIFGLAVGARFGLVSMAAHAVGVPLAIVAVVLIGTPAFFVGALHSGLELDARSLVAAMARGTAAAGFVLAGLSPAMGLYSLSAESVETVGILAALGLATAGLLAQRGAFRDLPKEPSFASARLFLVKWGFALFAAVLAGRVWWLVLPVYSGAPATTPSFAATP